MALGALLAGACGTTPSPATGPTDGWRLDDADLLAVLLRWDQCVRRHQAPASAAQAASVASFGRAIRESRSGTQAVSRACEGYQRDIAYRFPRHLESRVRARLSGRVRQRTAVQPPARTPDADTLIDSLIADHPDAIGVR